MIWVIPMAGKGTRTKSLGEFKPFITIRGKKILEWFLLSIKNNISPKDYFVFITTEYFSQKFKVEYEIKKIWGNYQLKNGIKLLTCPETPKGTSATVYLARKELILNKPVTIINPDQCLDFVLPNSLEFQTGYLAIYAEFSNKSGYVKIKNGRISCFIEKNNLSNLASAGVFILSEGQALISALENQFKQKILTNNEYYLGPAFNFLINKGYKIYPLPIKAKYDLGNIEDINHFENNPFIR